MSDGMFLTACREVAREFPDIAYDEDLLDRACLQVGNVFNLVPLLRILTLVSDRPKP